MPLFNYEISLILTLSADCIISTATGAKKFAITDTILFTSVVLYQLKIIQNLYNN